MSIRFARKADCAAIAEIYNHAVLYTAAVLKIGRASCRERV